jgi:hypothetical protein
MRKKWKGIIIVCFVLAVMGSFISCSTEELAQATDQDIANLGTAMGAAFTGLDYEIPPSGISVEFDDPQNPSVITITWTNYDAGGIIINGSLVMSISTTSETLSVYMVGTLTFSGLAPVTSVALNMTATIDLVTFDLTLFGHITIDDTKFDASSFVGFDPTAFMP